MSNENNIKFVYWEDMWNLDENETQQKECCGKWDKLGTCNCKKNETIN